MYWVEPKFKVGDLIKWEMPVYRDEGPSETGVGLVIQVIPPPYEMSMIPVPNEREVEYLISAQHTFGLHTKQFVLLESECCLISGV